MMSQFELSSRAALCRQLAREDAANRTVWMAEARSWSLMAAEALRDERGSDEGIVARFFFAFSKLVAAQQDPTNRSAEMMKSRSRTAMPSRSSSPTVRSNLAKRIRATAYLAPVQRQPEPPQ
jgi:hypothetical protein